MSREDPGGTPSAGGRNSGPLVSGDDGWERRAVIGAGMVGACVLGVVAGVWARPHENGEIARLSAAREAYGPLPNQLQVVLEPDLQARLESPLQIAAGAEPVSVIPNGAAPPAAAPVAAPVAAAPPPEPVRPKSLPPPVRLIKAEAPLRTVEPERPVRTERPRPEKAKIVQAKAEAPAAKPEKVRASKAAEADKVEKLRLAKLERRKAAAREKAQKAEVAEQEARAEKKVAARKIELAEAERDKAEAREKAAKTRLVKADKPTAKPQASRLAAAKPLQAKSVPVRPTVHLAATRPAPVRSTAVNAPDSTLDLQLAALRAEPLKAEPVKISVPVSTPKPAVAVRPAVAVSRPGAAPISAARTCDADSRAEELVCADPRLAAADRRMSAAYRHALQAGASPDRLRRQQGRWLAARAQAADEAPWALTQVYAVRIAELNDEAAQAAEDD